MSRILDEHISNSLTNSLLLLLQNLPLHYVMISLFWKSA